MEKEMYVYINLFLSQTSMFWKNKKLMRQHEAE